MQKCQSQPQAQDPRTGRNYLYCSNECAAPRTLPGLPIGFNVGNSQGTSAEADPQSNPFLLPCDVSLYSRIAGQGIAEQVALQSTAREGRGVSKARLYIRIVAGRARILRLLPTTPTPGAHRETGVHPRILETASGY